METTPSKVSKVSKVVVAQKFKAKKNAHLETFASHMRVSCAIKAQGV